MTTPRADVPRLTLLGRFSLLLQDEPVRLSRASERVIALLAVHRGRLARRSLSTRLWADSTDARATSNLRSALWRLPRTATAPLVSVTTHDVALHPDVHVDLWDSAEHAQSLRRLGTGAPGAPSDPGSDVDPTQVPDVGPETVHLLEHDLLPDWSEEWLDIEQESFRQLRLHALEAHSGLQLVRGRAAAALEAALRAVQGDPLRESAHRAVIAVHLAEDNPAEALRQFHAYRRLLARELGLPPSAAIRDQVAHLLGRPLDGRPPRRR